MRVVFRTDSSTGIGTGHLYRCLALADALRRKGATALFLCRDLPGNLVAHVEECNFEVRRLAFRGPQDDSWVEDAGETLHHIEGTPKPDWLVVDHYALDGRWEHAVRRVTANILVIDDLADRTHDCDLLLDQTPYDVPGLRYAGLVPGRCRMLFGPRYALLRREFVEAGETRRRRDGSVRRVLVFFGGSDPTDETAKTLEAMRILNRPDIALDVVAGGANPRREHVRRLCLDAGNASFHSPAINMAELMANADLAIGAPGTSTWERCYMGLPALTLVVAENQVLIAEQVSRGGAISNLGWSREVDPAGLAAAVRRLLADPGRLREMSRRGVDLMGGDSFAGTEGVIREMTGDARAQA